MVVGLTRAVFGLHFLPFYLFIFYLSFSKPTIPFAVSSIGVQKIITSTQEALFTFYSFTFFTFPSTFLPFKSSPYTLLYIRARNGKHFQPIYDNLRENKCNFA